MNSNPRSVENKTSRLSKILPLIKNVFTKVDRMLEKQTGSQGLIV